jgi:opacity protein-like surface antigen
MKTHQKLFMPSIAILAFNLLNPACFNAEAGNFYLSTSAGVLAPKKIPSTTSLGQEEPNYNYTFKYKIKPAFLFAIGLGYYITEDLRMELEYIKPFMKDITSNSADVSAASADVINTVKGLLDGDKISYKQISPTLVNIPANYKIKPNINAFYFKLYYDALKIHDNAKIYLGTGLGVSKIQSKYFNVDPLSAYDDIDRPTDYKSLKSKVNFTYLAAIGASYNFNESIAMSVEYNYIDFGKSCYYKDADVTLGGKRFAGSVGMMKLRFRF